MPFSTEQLSAEGHALGLDPEKRPQFPALDQHPPISLRQRYRLIRSGRLRAVKVSGQTYIIHTVDLIRFLVENRTGSPDTQPAASRPRGRPHKRVLITPRDRARTRPRGVHARPRWPR